MSILLTVKEDQLENIFICDNLGSGVVRKGGEGACIYSRALGGDQWEECLLGC